MLSFTFNWNLSFLRILRIYGMLLLIQPYIELMVVFVACFLVSDFEHLMGSLVFLGRDLRDTPYADLALNCNLEEPMHPTFGSMGTADSQGPVADVDLGQSDPMVSLLNPEGAVAQAASLFKTNYCRQLNLTDADPLCTVFNSGCKLLSRQQALQRAISCLTKYSNMDGDTLPVGCA